MTIKIPHLFRGRRRLFWLLMPLLVLILVIAACEMAGWPFLRKPLQNAAAQAARVPVLIEDGFKMRLFWRPQVQVGHLRVGAASGVEGADSETAPHLLDARDLDARWSWLDIWRWRGGAPLRVQRLHASSLDARLLRDKAGHATWQIGEPSTEPKDEADAAGGLPRVGSLQVGQGTIVFDDAVLNTVLKVDMQGGEGAQAGAAAGGGGYRASIKGRWQKLPLDLKVSSGAVLPLLADDTAGGRGADADIGFSVKGTAGAAEVAFEGRAGAVLGAQNLDGSLSFSGPSLGKVGEPVGLTLPETPPFALKGHLARNSGVWQLKAESMTIGSSRLDGEFRFDPGPKPPQLTGRLGGTRLALADLGPAVGAPTSSAATKAPAAADKAAADGRLLPDKRLDLPSLRAMNADVAVAIDEFDFGTGTLAPLKRLKTQVVLADSVLKLSDLSAVVAGGEFSGSTQLDAREREARWALDLKLATVDMGAWLRGLKAGSAASAAGTEPKQGGSIAADRKQARSGGDQPAKSYVTGALSGHVRLTGRGNSTADILGHVDGDGSLLLKDGTVSHLVTEGLGLDLAQALGVLVKGDTPLPLRCARLSLSAADGLLKLDRAVLDNADSTIRIAGGINLRNEQMALKAVSKPKDFSPLSLNSPVTIGGTLNSPSVGIEGSKLAAKAAGAALLAAAVGPLAALIPFIEFPDGAEKIDPCTDKPSASASSSASASASASSSASASRSSPSRR